MHLILQNKSVKIFFLSLGMVIVSIFFGMDNSKALLGYIQTKIITENNQEFLVNDVRGKHNNVAINDTISSLNGNVTFILNNLSTVTLLPHSQIQFLKLGEDPILRILDGSIDVQSMSLATIYAGSTIATVEQGGLFILQKDDYSQFGNYYGSNSLNIFNEKKEFILSYKLPIQKQVTIFEKRDKNSWNKILYSKLNKELLLQSFSKTIIRETFSSSIPQIESSPANWLEKHFTINPKKSQDFSRMENYRIMQNLIQHIADKSPALIKADFQEMKNSYSNTEYGLLQKILFSINDPFIRYVYETELLKIHNKEIASLSTEIKYLYSILSLQNANYEDRLYESIEQKIQSHKNKLNQLAEDYNLLTAFLEAYPGIVTQKIMNIKSSLEEELWLVSKTSTEKQDLLLEAFEYDLKLIPLLVQNDKGNLAEELFKNMLIDKANFDESQLMAYRNQLSNVYRESLKYLQFYEEELHSAAYSPKGFERFVERKEKEENAIAIYSNNQTSLRKRPIRADFAETVKEFKKQSIQIVPENIDFAFNTGKLLFVKKAIIEGTDLIFDCVYNQETKTISAVSWESTILPPMEDDIPLSEFQRSYNELLEMKIPEEQKKKEIIADWAPSVGSSYNYEYEIKKRTAKQKLSALGVYAKEMNMEAQGNILQANMAEIVYIDEKKQEHIVKTAIRLNINDWSLLGIQLEDFPERKLRVVAFAELKNKVISAYEEERQYLVLKEDALRGLQSISREISLQNIRVENFYQNTVRFGSIPAIIQNGDQEIALRIDGVYNAQTLSFETLNVEHAEKTFSLSGIHKSQFQATMIQKLFPSKKKQKSSTNTEEILQESLGESSDLSESELLEIKEILQEKI